MLALGVLLLGGCHSRPDMNARDYGPLTGPFGEGRSLALPGDGIRSASAAPLGYEPWYVGRNDRVPSVVVGYESARFEQSTTYTRDQQVIINGRVFDRYDETTYRRSFSESLR